MTDQLQPIEKDVGVGSLTDLGGASSLRVSLMPADSGTAREPDAQRRLIVGGAILASLFLLLLAGNILLAFQVDRREKVADGLRQQISQVESDIMDKRLAAKRVSDFQRQLDVLSDSYDQHAYWTGFFDFIENNTLPTVRFRNFNGDMGGGVFTVDAIAANYREAALQLVHLRSLSEVVLLRTGSLSLLLDADGQTEGVSFTMTVKVKPEVWLQRPKSIAAVDLLGAPSAPDLNL